MTRKSYFHIMNWVKKWKYGVVAVRWTGKLITYFTAVIYFLCAGELLWKRDLRLIPFLMVPAVSFLLVSFFREWYGARRPYEVYDFVPLVPKTTQKKSFPSRHVFSIFIIATVVAWIMPVSGAVLLVLGSVLAILRVIMGVHFPKDVIAGAVMGIVCGMIGVWGWLI